MASSGKTSFMRSSIPVPGLRRLSAARRSDSIGRVLRVWSAVRTTVCDNRATGNARGRSGEPRREIVGLSAGPAHVPGRTGSELDAGGGGGGGQGGGGAV